MHHSAVSSRACGPAALGKLSVPLSMGLTPGPAGASACASQIGNASLVQCHFQCHTLVASMLTAMFNETWGFVYLQ